MPILQADAKPELLAEYEDFIASSPYGSMLQSIHWAKVKNNWTPHYVYLRDQETQKITAAMSVLEVRNPNGYAFFYAPRGPVCDPKDIETVKSLVNEVSELARQQRAFLLRLDPEALYSEELVQLYRGQDWCELRTKGDCDEHDLSNPRNNMILPFAGRGIEEIIACYPRKFRYAIRRSYKDGLETRVLTPDAPDLEETLDSFYKLTLEMAKRKGIGCRPREYFSRLMQAFPGARLYETKDSEGEVLSAGIVVHYRTHAFYIYAATGDNKRHLQPSVQMIIEAMTQAIAEGMETFDFGGVYGFDASDGLFLYKNRYCIAGGGLHEYLGEIEVVYEPEIYRDFIS